MRDNARRVADRAYHVLFLCTGNSARSLLAECLLRRLGRGRFRAFSAGSHPKPAPHPLTLELLEAEGHDTSLLRSKSWDEFAAPGAPPLDFVFTVCDDARGEACPVWPGQPVTAHWGVEDPAASEGSPELQRAVFRRAYRALEHRISIFASLPLESLDRLSLRARLEEIGKSSPRA
jgi:protein-tyrosine-phosphatase